MHHIPGYKGADWWELENKVRRRRRGLRKECKCRTNHGTLFFSSSSSLLFLGAPCRKRNETKEDPFMVEMLIGINWNESLASRGGGRETEKSIDGDRNASVWCCEPFCLLRVVFISGDTWNNPAVCASEAYTHSGFCFRRETCTRSLVTGITSETFFLSFFCGLCALIFFLISIRGGGGKT